MGVCPLVDLYGSLLLGALVAVRFLAFSFLVTVSFFQQFESCVDLFAALGPNPFDFGAADQFRKGLAVGN